MNMWGAGGRFNRVALMLLFLVVGICLTSCASNAGVFAGGKWQAGGLQHQQLLSLTVDPNNPQIIYAGDTRDGVFASTNSGTNWSKQSVGLPLPISIFALVFDDPGKKLYAATNMGVFVSANATIKWVHLTGLPEDSYSSIAFDLNAPHVIYVASVSHGVYVSKDNGSTWNAVNKGLPSGIVIHGLAFDSVEHHLWAATNMGVYRSDNDGGLWLVLNKGLPSGIVVNTILPAANSGGDKGLVFAGTNHGFFLSHDDGSQWSHSQVLLIGTSINAVLIDYHTVTTVYAGTGIGVLRSDDNGQNWGGIASGLPRDQAVQALAIGANGYNQLFAATNGIYLFPGNSNTFDPSQIFPILLILAFFFVLYQVSTRGRRRSQSMFKNERKVESEKSSPRDHPQTEKVDMSRTDGLPEAQGDKREYETDQADGSGEKN
ncbi:MAG: WD40/YVTN/BNR-like repeat-containing protein [Ktedonobacteraceae bacterium]